MTHKNLVLKRAKKKPIVWDIFYQPNGIKKPLVIFCHGYKGFKDWGAWDLVANTFKTENLCFVKFNFSHNGGTVDNPIDFPDLNTFAENNYTKELEDLDAVISFLVSVDNEYIKEIDTANITLIGHSRGGGICTLKAAEDKRITRLITWASVCDFGKRTATTGNLEQWQKEGVKYVENSRTKQMMPHNYQFYEDYISNKELLDIKKACSKINIPHLIIHGKEDSSVAFQEALSLHQWNPKSKLLPIENANHVFNVKHPWDEEGLPDALKKVVKHTISFIS